MAAEVDAYAFVIDHHVHAAVVAIADGRLAFTVQMLEPSTITLPLLNRGPNLRHVAARDGERFVAMLDKQLCGAGMRDNLLYLTKVDQKGAMAADNHRVALQRLLQLFHRGAKHIGMHLSVAQMAYLDVVAHGLNK